MADSITIARPYARAAFEQAREQQQLSLWFEYLCKLSAMVQDKNALLFLTNPSSRASQHADLLIEGLTQPNEALLPEIKNFIQVLAENKRLLILPEVAELYQTMRAEEEKTIVVHVSSYMEMSASEQEKMIASLSKLLSRKVSLKVSIDKALLGGAVIRADDLVIDGSVLGKINKLRAELAA